MSDLDRKRSKLPLFVLKHRDYRLLWGGQFISILGTQMQSVALAWHVYDLTGSVFQLGMLGLVRAISLMSTAFLGGAVADSVDRKKLMYVTQSIMIVLTGGLAAMTWMDATTIWLLYVFAATTAAVSAFDGPARQALIPNLVPREDLGPAISLNMLAMSTARMIGPAIGGLSIDFFGLGATYFLDSLSFLATIGALVAMTTVLRKPTPQTRGIQAVKEGLSFMLATPIIWGIMLLDFLATLLGSTVGLAPVFAKDVLNAGPQGLGLLLSAPAAGSVLGAIVVSVMPQVERPGKIVVASVIAYGACLALFGMSPSLLLALAALAGAGAADSVSVAMRHTVRTIATPDELRGRVAAAHSAMAMGGPRLGEFQSGLTASMIGPQSAMIFGGFACIAAAVGVARFVRPVMQMTLHELEISGDLRPADGGASLPLAPQGQSAVSD